MYANLRVVPARGASVMPDAIATRTLQTHRDSTASAMIACEVEVRPDGSMRVVLDVSEDKCAEPAGVVRIEGGGTVTASF